MREGQRVIEDRPLGWINHRLVAIGIGLLLMGTALAPADPLDSIPHETQRVDTALSAADRRQAQQWQLSEAEWQRYRVLMTGIRGSLSVATISPIEVLGIHAPDEAERRRYAERWAQLMHEDAERVLAFQRAYSEAFQRLYPNEPLIDLSQLPGAAPAIRFQPGDRLLFFARTDCGRCATLVPPLLHTLQAQPGVGLDIYLVRVGQALGVPPPLLYAVALTESARRLRGDTVRPWPWSLQVNGQAEYHASRQAAYRAIRRHLVAGRRSIDIGLMQLNWRWHHESLQDPWQALDPYHNLRIGARLLREHYRECGDWLTAAGRYHAPATTKQGRALASAYRKRIAKQLARFKGPGGWLGS